MDRKHIRTIDDAILECGDVKVEVGAVVNAIKYVVLDVPVTGASSPWR